LLLFTTRAEVVRDLPHLARLMVTLLRGLTLGVDEWFLLLFFSCLLFRLLPRNLASASAPDSDVQHRGVQQVVLLVASCKVDFLACVGDSEGIENLLPRHPDIPSDKLHDSL